jgi:GNAT superfamily N-acetyltransferase
MMSVRPIQPHELPTLLELYKHLHSDDDPVPEPRIVDAVWQELMANRRYKYFGVFEREKMLSSCTITVIPNLTRACRPYGVIENVVTHKSHRNQGHGKAVLMAALSHAWLEGCYKVMLLTGRKDQATFEFYESAGFDRNEKQAFIAKPK